MSIHVLQKTVCLIVSHEASLHFQINQLCQVGHQFKVEINVRQAAGQVVIDGLQPDVFDAVQKISEVLRKIDRQRQEAQTAGMLANMVQWSFLEVSSSCNTLCLHVHSGMRTIKRKQELQFSSVQDDVYTLRSFHNIVFEMVPMFILSTMALSHPFKEDCLALPLSIPLSSRQWTV